MKRLRRIPPLFRFLAANCIAGIVTSWLFLGGIVWLDVGGLYQLLSRSPDAGVAIAVLAVGFAVTFGSAAMATAVWLMPYGDGQGGKGDRRRVRLLPTLQLAPVHSGPTSPTPLPR